MCLNNATKTKNYLKILMFGLILVCLLPNVVTASESSDVFEQRHISQTNIGVLETPALDMTKSGAILVPNIHKEYVNLINGNSLMATEMHEIVRQDLVSEVERLYTNSSDWTAIVSDYLSVYDEYNHFNDEYAINPYSEGVYSSNNVSLVFDSVNREVYLVVYYSDVIPTDENITNKNRYVPGQWFYTPTYLQGATLYNILNQKIGEHRLEGYFRINLRDTPEGFITEHYANQGGVYVTTEEHDVVPNYSARTCKLYMDTDASLLQGDINLFPVRWHFAIISDFIGAITYEGEQR